jgi:hypothetical protein
LPNRQFAWLALALLLPILATGCFCLSIGGSEKGTSEDGIVKQSGKIELDRGRELDVYYPIPYASTPNLELDDWFNNYRIIEQKADHFRVKNVGGAFGVEWTARGVRACNPTPLAVPVPTPAPPSSP